jgi:hypothetical protein
MISYRKLLLAVKKYKLITRYSRGAKQMSKDVINVGGEEKVVREDTAKSYRGVVWALLSVGAFVIIAAILMLSGFFRAASDGKPMESPASIENKRN